MKKLLCLSVLFSVLLFMLPTKQVIGQAKEDSATMLLKQIKGSPVIRKEDKVRYYYTDPQTGKKKYVSESKNQHMWTEILMLCPSCISVARKYNVNIYQNKEYVKKEKSTVPIPLM